MTILAEMDDQGLYACGPVNLAILAIMLGLATALVSGVVLGVARSSPALLALGVLAFLPGVPIGFAVSARLAQDSCVGTEWE